MIPVPRPDLADAQWQAWRGKAREATDALVSHYHPGDDVKLQEQLYKDAKPFLLDLFHGKCAYCETVISSNQPGDVEHYRPKGRIRDKDGQVVKVRFGNKEVEHPGYWWLAYDWRNLLPSCADCNRRRWHETESVAAGKADYFVVRGPRAIGPSDDLTQERALLLDPTKPDFDSKQHFEFNENGTIKPTTEEGSYSCELLGLNLREKLVAQRAQAYLQAKINLGYLLAQAVAATPETLAPLRRQLNDMWEGRSAYSAFARQALQDTREKLIETTGVRVELPLP
jgi:uncharacterized protein (TIGR02646 family)